MILLLVAMLVALKLERGEISLLRAVGTMACTLLMYVCIAYAHIHHDRRNKE